MSHHMVSHLRRVCIVGAGPSGIYSAQHLLKQMPDISIDFVEKLPIPHGLVRYGVAPDHQDVKNVEHQFWRTIRNGRVRFFGNIAVSHVLGISKLRSLYDAVLCSYGCSKGRSLGLPGESTTGNIFSAEDFVGWYSSHPHHTHLRPNFDTDTALVIGQGNVAIDIARMLLADVESLRRTDILSHAVDLLSQSKIRKVICVGRRSLADVSFTIKEFRELTKLPGVRTEVLLEQDINTESFKRPKKRLVDLCKTFACSKFSQSEQKSFRVMFNRRPVKFLKNSSTGLVDAVEFDTLSGTETVKAGLVVKSIGYYGQQIDPDLPFDEERGVIRHDGSGRVSPGLYCSGWVKSGPVGVLASTLADAQSTAETIIEDLGKLPVKESLGDIAEILEQSGIPYSTVDDWERINEYELSTGAQLGKCREKIPTLTEFYHRMESLKP